ncbi:SDR family oxidoreductase [Pseudorhodoferax sp.]|uniref:SDR family oxidoreductase n=1 Tax=Pseudorhodoferax sp. TaxID=1993553 RepID=UPI002DD61E89|nr:SDR family oxidoreductase [Pseudorhodoferax sp.]
MADTILQDPRTKYPVPPFPKQHQDVPGRQSAMQPVPDCGEDTYVGSGKLTGRKAVITGGDSGIGRAVAIAYAREGADIVISYLNEHDDAQATAKLVRDAGRKCVVVPGDIQDPRHCQAIVQRAVDELGGLDLLVNNAAFQMSHKDLQDFSAEELDRTFRTNVFATFFLTQAAVPHMPPGSSVINTASINADKPNATLVAYAATKGALQNLTGGLAQLLAEKGIRVNCVAPGPVWTPLIPSTMDAEKASQFGAQVPLKRPGQPAELASAYVMLASEGGSYISGATVAVTGGVPLI